jgi:hypothetical protein
MVARKFRCEAAGRIPASPLEERARERTDGIHNFIIVNPPLGNRFFRLVTP